ncbi:MAG: hypothetical protein CVT80_08895 [Alphaproteobacteria bacterium HGW-Alphaproteobacteria-2]|nr:MAG: hypothetical protein CVT80_08895 [Alphaproteobacteria bacterium HGW-Alphaproteobacteria-2]
MAPGKGNAQETLAGWSFQMTPYVWATGLGGSLRPLAAGPKISIDKSFGDILEDLDVAFFVTGLARRDRLVLLGDFSTSSSSRGGVVPPGIPAKGSLRQTSLTLLAGYRAVSEGPFTLDVLAGARVWDVRARVNAPVVPIRVARERSFADPVVAARVNLRLAPGWSLLAYGDVGGAGIGSRFTSQLAATVNYEFSERFFLSAGYRQLHVDYREDGMRVDLRMKGPLVGATLRF